MINLLMFGSSHSASYKDLKSSNYNLSICAGKKGRLIKGLSFASDGLIVPIVNSFKRPWPQSDISLFEKSLGISSRNINNYDYFIVNITFYLDLPMLIHGDSQNPQEIILNTSDNLFKKIIAQNSPERNTILFVNKLKLAGIDEKRIFIFPVPFTTIDKEVKEEENNEKLKNKISKFLTLVDDVYQKKLPKLILPDIDMYQNGLFIKRKYGTGRNKWTSKEDKKNRKYDRTHKNPQYAERLMNKVFEFIKDQK